MDRKMMHTIVHSQHLYPDGCVLCDAIETLNGVAQHGTGVPWSTPDYDESECVRLIEQIRQAYKIN